MSVWANFSKNVDIKGLKEDIKGASENSGDFKEVTPGNYEVTIEKMEIKTSKKGDPMLSIWFTILSGDFKGSKIFYNQMLTTGFGLHNAMEFLRSLGTDVIISIDDVEVFDEVVDDVFAKVDGILDYELEYGVTPKGFNTYSIKQVFEK